MPSNMHVSPQEANTVSAMAFSDTPAQHNVKVGEIRFTDGTVVRQEYAVGEGA